jgi:hypothetical protein
MPLLRIIFGVLIGIGFIVGLAFLANQFPTAAARIWFMILSFGGGALFVWFVVRGLRLGVTTVGRFARYERSVSPFHFWFYILFLFAGRHIASGRWCMFLFSPLSLVIEMRSHRRNKRSQPLTPVRCQIVATHRYSSMPKQNRKQSFGGGFWTGKPKRDASRPEDSSAKQRRQHAHKAPVRRAASKLRGY